MINKKVHYFYTLICLILLSSCSAYEPWTSSEFQEIQKQDIPSRDDIKFSLFLIGDAGDPNLTGPDKLLTLFSSAIEMADNDAAAVFLGDNIYDYGFETSPPEARDLSEQKIQKSLDVLANPEIPGFFIPGNHDWWSNFEGLQAQQQFIEENELNTGHIKMTPNAGCPGPVVNNFNDYFVLVSIDSEWFMRENGEDLAKQNNCTYQTREQSMEALGNLSNEYRDQVFILNSHHPLQSRGEHGGHYTWKQHIFPLRELNSALWLPLPVVGSLYPLIRNIGLSNQDFGGSLNKSYRRSVEKQLEDHPKFIVASGHEHSLQYIFRDNYHQIVSASGSLKAYVVKGGPAHFLLADHGFAVLQFYGDGTIWLEFWTSNEAFLDNNPIFNAPIDTY